ncbi:DUF3887 domain-containing protein [Amphibacillus sp. Q70]|uniref:DUF3887 domain-containing protein n=1 Tax=Amphibacillus sp. Q70 TaxID=3453416 RepID=UPI003F857338
MKKNSFLILVFSIIFGLAACNGNSADEQTSEALTERTEQVVDLLNNQEYSEMVEYFDETMAAQLPAEVIENELEPIINESGNFEEFEKSSVEERDGGYTVTLVAKYSETKRVYTVSYNMDDQISGFFIK